MPKPWPRGLARTILDQTDSTNTEAQRMGTAGAPHGWVMARHQTSGRGSRGRNWHSATGNFAASLLLRPDATPQSAALRSFVAALALAETFEELGVAPNAIALKWPNDALISGKKCAGILLESSGSGQKLDYIVVGIGINLASAPERDNLPSNALPATTVGENIGTVPEAEHTLDILAPAYDALEHSMQTYGFEPIRQAWLARAANRGHLITAQIGQEIVSGVFETLDETGALVLTTATGPRRISTGEIFFPNQC